MSIATVVHSTAARRSLWLQALAKRQGVFSCQRQQRYLSATHSSAKRHDQFGGALAAGNFDGAGSYDLAIASPSEEEGTTYGSVNVLYGDDLIGLSDVLYQLLMGAPQAGF